MALPDALTLTLIDTLNCAATFTCVAAAPTALIASTTQSVACAPTYCA